MQTVFLEALHRFTCGLKRGAPYQRVEQQLGGGLDDGGGCYRFDAEDALGPYKAQLTAPPPSPAPEEFERVAKAIEAAAVAAGAERVDVTLRETHRAILAGPAEAPRRDARSLLQLEVRCQVGAGANAQSTLLERAYASLPALNAERAAMEKALAGRVADARARLQSLPAPTGALPIVLPPGADAGVLFHELCGHPLEGDVVARRASWLAQRLGESVAPEFVTLVDDPTAGPRVAGYAVDDEGTEARAAHLLRGGKVDEPLLDLRSAQTLQREPNGHGRRATHRRFALPRMSHTALAAHQGSFEELVSEVKRGLCVGYLTPRRIDLLSGDFSFLCPEARLIEDGKLGAFVQPLLIEGNALEALRGIERVGADLDTFYGMKGCGKLDQGGLPVSFGNPSLRIAKVHVRPAP